MTKLSYSALSTFKSCPQKYYYQKQWRPKLNASALPFGSAVEDGVTALLEGKTLAHALEIFKAHWLTRPANKYEAAHELYDSPSLFYYSSDYDKNLITDIDQKMIDVWGEEILGNEYKTSEDSIKEAQDVIKHGGTMSKELRKFYHRVVWLCCRRRGIWLIKAFQEQILPKVKAVHAIQKETLIKNSDGDSVPGFIDYILEIENVQGPVIFDCKTAGKPYEMHQLNTSDQLRSYSAAEKIPQIGYLVLLKAISCDKLCNSCGHARENNRLKNCEACDIGKYTISKPSPKTQILTKQVDAQEITDVMNDFSEVLTAVKNDVKWKNPTACFNFGKKCEYYEACWGNKTIEQLKKEDQENDKYRGD